MSTSITEKFYEGDSMAVVITRMPSTGEITNVSTDSRSLQEVKKTWSNVDYVEVMQEDEFESLPKCPTCGQWVGFKQCNDCR